MKVTALLPMKGHSERVKGKNLKLFNGSPLYHCIVKSLMKANLVENICIDTDCKEIRQDVENNFPDIKVIDRPKNLCGDLVSVNKIIEHDLSIVDSSYFFQTHSTNPLLKSSTIDKAIDTYFKNLDKYDCLFSVIAHSTRFFTEDLVPINHDPKKLLRTQDTTRLFEENSSVYVFSRSSFENAGGRRIGNRPLCLEMGKYEVLDIDYPKDFLIAEHIWRIRDEI